MLPHPEDSEKIESLFSLDEISRPIQDQRVLEAKVTFGLATMLVLIGCALIIWGFWSAIYSGAATLSLFVAKESAGTLLSIIGTVVRQLHEKAHSELSRFQRDRDAIHAILQISNQKSRDAAILGFAQSLQDGKHDSRKKLSRTQAR